LPNINLVSIVQKQAQKLDVRLIVGLSFSAILFSVFDSAVNVILLQYQSLLNTNRSLFNCGLRYW